MGRKEATVKDRPLTSVVKSSRQEEAFRFRLLLWGIEPRLRRAVATLPRSPHQVFQVEMFSLRALLGLGVAPNPRTTLGPPSRG